MLRKLCHKRCASFFDTSPLWSKWRPNVAWFPSNMSWKPILPIPPAWSNTIGVKVRTRHVLYFGWYYNRRLTRRHEGGIPESWDLLSEIISEKYFKSFLVIIFPTPVGPQSCPPPSAVQARVLRAHHWQLEISESLSIHEAFAWRWSLVKSWTLQMLKFNKGWDHHHQLPLSPGRCWFILALGAQPSIAMYRSFLGRMMFTKRHM